MYSKYVYVCLVNISVRKNRFPSTFIGRACLGNLYYLSFERNSYMIFNIFFESNIFRRRVHRNITHTGTANGRTYQCPGAEVGGLCSGQEGQHQKDVLLLGVSPWKLIGWISTFRLLIHSINTPSSLVRSISPCRMIHTYTGYRLSVALFSLSRVPTSKDHGIRLAKTSLAKNRVLAIDIS